MDFELESKSVMIYINEETINKLKEYPSIEEKDPITGEWNTAMVTVNGMNNKNPEEKDNNGGLEYTEEEFAYNKIDDVMVNKKCLNTEIKTHVKTVEEEDEEICKINKNLNHDQGPFIYRDDGETIWNRPGYDIQEKQNNEMEMFYLDGKIMSVGYNNDDENEVNKKDVNKFITRNHFSNMMFSHIFMIIPCIWWMRIDRPHTDSDIFYSKLMSIIMTTAIIASYLYHYYNECVLCTAETDYNKFAIVCLNIYMYLRNVSIFYIIPGGGILYGLHKSLEYCNSKNNKDIYELYHPFCHYIAGYYIYYCVWNLERVQPKICDTTNNNIMFNDLYSGVNYNNI